MTAAPKICPNKKRKFFIWASFHNESLVAHYLGVRARGVVILLISSGLVLSHTRSQKAFVYNKSKDTTIGPCDGASAPGAHNRRAAVTRAAVGAAPPGPRRNGEVFPHHGPGAGVPLHQGLHTPL